MAFQKLASFAARCFPRKHTELILSVQDRKEASDVARTLVQRHVAFDKRENAKKKDFNLGVALRASELFFFTTCTEKYSSCIWFTVMQP